jgi:hypothetical protein
MDNDHHQTHVYVCFEFMPCACLLHAASWSPAEMLRILLWSHYCFDILSTTILTCSNAARVLRVSSCAAGKATDVEGGVPSAGAELDRIKRTIVEMEKAVAVAAPEDRAEIQKSLDELRTAAARMSEVNTLASAQASHKH